MLESDANAAALAEWNIGAGSQSGAESMCMLTLDTGVGAGLILNARVWHGYNGMAGEMGHTCVQSEGLECSCGGRSCLERYALPQRLLKPAEGGSERINPNRYPLLKLIR